MEKMPQMPMTTCPECRGTGKIKPRTKDDIGVACPVCKGRGKMPG